LDCWIVGLLDCQIIGIVLFLFFIHLTI